MKATLLLAWCGLPLALSAALPPELQTGDTRERVIQCLGEPTGRVVVQAREWLHFPRGQVMLLQGRVSGLELISEEELNARRLAAAQEQADREARAAIARVERIEEGGRLLERARVDPVFAVSPASTRLAYWRSFSTRFPEINVSLELAGAAGEVQRATETLRAQAADQARQAELERRVVEAEAKAAQAERMARQRDRQVYLSYPYSSGGYAPGGYFSPVKCLATPVPVPRPPIHFQLDGPRMPASAPVPYNLVWEHPSANTRGVIAYTQDRSTIR